MLKCKTSTAAQNRFSFLVCKAIVRLIQIGYHIRFEIGRSSLVILLWFYTFYFVFDPFSPIQKYLRGVSGLACRATLTFDGDPYRGLIEPKSGGLGTCGIWKGPVDPASRKITIISRKYNIQHTTYGHNTLGRPCVALSRDSNVAVPAHYYTSGHKSLIH